MSNQQIKSLIKIGLREIEADIYLVLLKDANITAYKIAKIIEKPKTTVYKALEIMQSKGLIRCNAAYRPVTFSVVEIKEYLDEKEKQFRENRAKVENELKNIERIPSNTGIFPITRLEQVISKAEEILNRAEKIVLIACVRINDPRIQNAIQKAVDRGIKIMIQSFIEIPNVRGVDYSMIELVDSDDENILYNWLEIFSDGREYLISLISNDDQILFKAQWCNDPYPSILNYNSNLGSLVLTKVKNQISEGKSHQELLEIIDKDMHSYYQWINMEKIKHLTEY